MIRLFAILNEEMNKVFYFFCFLGIFSWRAETSAISDFHQFFEAIHEFKSVQADFVLESSGEKQEGKLFFNDHSNFKVTMIDYELASDGKSLWEKSAEAFDYYAVAEETKMAPLISLINEFFLSEKKQPLFENLFQITKKSGYYSVQLKKNETGFRSILVSLNKKTKFVDQIKFKKRSKNYSLHLKSWKKAEGASFESLHLPEMANLKVKRWN